MRILRSLKRLMHMSPSPGAGSRLQRPDQVWTAVLMRFSDGSSRTFIWDRQFLSGDALHLRLDPLLEEMRELPFNGPLEVYRSDSSNSLQTETVGLLPDD